MIDVISVEKNNAGTSVKMCQKETVILDVWLGKAWLSRWHLNRDLKKLGEPIAQTSGRKALWEVETANARYLRWECVFEKHPKASVMEWIHEVREDWGPDRSFPFLQRFWNQLDNFLFSLKKTFWGFEWYCIKLIDEFVINQHLNNISCPPICEHGIASAFIELISLTSVFWFGE